jgi:hypothetical protein
VEYARQGGARLAGLGASSGDSVTDDPVLSAALQQFRNVSQGRRGNFYWALDPLGKDYVGSTAHVIVFAATRRITFPTDNLDEATIRHVLADIRTAPRSGARPDATHCLSTWSSPAPIARLVQAGGPTGSSPFARSATLSDTRKARVGLGMRASSPPSTRTSLRSVAPVA